MATNTVPIEIVLQDPANPIVPTPDSDGGSDNTNSNIAVPNTAIGEGHTTTDGSSNTGGFFSSSSAGATIIPAVVLTLAIATIIALLVHKYRKAKKTGAKATKKEHLAMAATSTMAVLAATVLVGQLLMTTTNAATSEGTVLSTPDKIQIIANRYDDVTIVASTKAVSYATTDTTFGYKIFMSMAGDNANLYLDGDTSNEYYFVPTTRAGLSNNSWGYSLDDGAEQAMPLAADPLMAQQNVNAVEGDEFTVYYTMKADKDMPFGVYSGEIAYDIEGYNGFPASLTTMQGMTSEICESTYTPNAFKADGVTIEDNVPTATLRDTRDDKMYTVAKLADGKCWMTRNLDLQKEDLLAGVTLNNTNTDNPAEGFELPDSQVTGDSYWGDGETNFNTAHVYDISNDGHEYYYCVEYDKYAGCVRYSDEIIPPETLHNFYNWYTTTAGTGTYNMGSGEIASGSICPAGWKLPEGSVDKPNGQFKALLQVYSITSENISDLLKAPFLFILGGYYGYGVKGVDVTEIIPTSMSYGNSNSWVSSFDYGRGSLSLLTSNNKNYGIGVRCVAK